MKNKENWCAHCIIDEWVNLVKSRLKLTFTEWLLFPRLDDDGTVKLGKQGKANELSDLLEGDLKGIIFLVVRLLTLSDMGK